MNHDTQQQQHNVMAPLTADMYCKAWLLPLCLALG